MGIRETQVHVASLMNQIPDKINLKLPSYRQ